MQSLLLANESRVTEKLAALKLGKQKSRTKALRLQHQLDHQLESSHLSSHRSKLEQELSLALQSLAEAYDTEDREDLFCLMSDAGHTETDFHETSRGQVS